MRWRFIILRHFPIFDFNLSSSVQCPPVGTFDLALLLDTHTDMGTPNLEATRAFAKSIVEKFDIGSDTTKVTVAGYSGEKVTPSTFLLDSNTNTKEQMLSTMSNINFSGKILITLSTIPPRYTHTRIATIVNSFVFRTRFTY